MSKSGLKNNKIYGMLLNGSIKGISILFSLIYVSLLVGALGKSKYGVWTTILTILSWFDLCDLGLGNGLRNKLTESIVKKDGKSREYISSTYVIISCISLLVCLILCCISYFFDWNNYFSVDLFDERITTVIIVSIIYASVNFVASLCKNILFALQKAYIVNGMGLLSQVLNVALIILFLNNGKISILLVALIYSNSVFFVNFIVSLIVFIKHNELRPSFKAYNKHIARDSLSLGWKFFVLQGCALILFSTDSIIITLLFDASEVTPYSITIKIYSLLINIFAAMLTPMWSAVTKEQIICGATAIKKLIVQILIIMIPFNLLALMLIYLFPSICGLWLHNGVYVSTSLIILGALYCILSNWCNSCATITNGLSIMRVPMIISCTQAVVNIPLSLLFVFLFNHRVEGVFLGTIVSMLISGILYPVVIANYLKKNK